MKTLLIISLFFISLFPQTLQAAETVASDFSITVRVPEVPDSPSYLTDYTVKNGIQMGIRHEGNGDISIYSMYPKDKVILAKKEGTKKIELQVKNEKNLPPTRIMLEFDQEVKSNTIWWVQIRDADTMEVARLYLQRRAQAKEVRARMYREHLLEKAK